MHFVVSNSNSRAKERRETVIEVNYAGIEKSNARHPSFLGSLFVGV